MLDECHLRPARFEQRNTLFDRIVGLRGINRIARHGERLKCHQAPRALGRATLENSAFTACGENDHHDGRPLYQAVVERMRELGLAGATVLRGIEGFGAHARLHTTRLLRLSEDLPVIIEIVDAAEKIEALGYDTLRQRPSLGAADAAVLAPRLLLWR